MLKSSGGNADIGTVQEKQDGDSESIQQSLANWIQLPGSRTIVICISILVYFLLVFLIYSATEGWDFMECIYFAIVVVTTVGYGDYLPTTDGSKFATICLCHFALALVAFSIGHVTECTKQSVARLSRMNEDGVGLLDEASARIRRRCRSLSALLVYGVVLLVGTIVFALCIDWDEDYPDDKGSRWLNGLYLTVITVTTIGFGDFSPHSSPGLQVFGCLLMLFGIPAAVAVLALVTETIFGGDQDVKLKVVKDGMTKEKFSRMNTFVNELRTDGIGNYRGQGNNKISRFEYLCFVLVRNNVIDTKNIDAVMQNFDTIDKTKSGFICVEDLEDTDRKTAEIRDTELRIGDRVEVYSASRQTWCPGVITHFWPERQKPMVTVAYRSSHCPVSREIAVDKENLRIVSSQNQQDEDDDTPELASQEHALHTIVEKFNLKTDALPDDTPDLASQEHESHTTVEKFRLKTDVLPGSCNDGVEEISLTSTLSEISV